MLYRQVEGQLRPKPRRK
ncbi:hypothetical protein BLA29_012460 [Euroglyphus maynei]|uniref:Uncharacterized protein n=1 Tax=Euroglyphus maynei TaxID=6958 RepID=A0A1Y3BHI2_EURMA|nr:hypothetical protein BLA29_012460 [Euroglyphus maynei]